MLAWTNYRRANINDGDETVSVDMINWQTDLAGSYKFHNVLLYV